MKYKALFICAGLALSATACNTDSDNDGNNDAKQIAQNYGSDPALQDSWESSCRSIPWPNMKYQKTEFVFTGMDFEHYVRLYENEDCSDVVGELRYKGTFSMKEVEGESYNTIDLNYDTATVHVRSEAGADLLNLANFCGRNDWEATSEEDVTEAERGTACPLYKTPAEYFDIIDREGEEMYFGTGFMGFAQDQSNRPEELNKEIVYTR